MYRDHAHAARLRVALTKTAPVLAAGSADPGQPANWAVGDRPVRRPSAPCAEGQRAGQPRMDGACGRIGRQIAANGYLTIAPEFYHRDAPPGRWLEPDDSGRQEGFAYLNRLTRPQALEDTAACIDWLKSQRGIGQIAMIGFSAGGHLSYLAACRRPISSAAVLYGGWLPTTDIPMTARTDAGPHRRDQRPDPLPGRRRRHADRRRPAPSDPRRPASRRYRPRIHQLPRCRPRVLLVGHARLQPEGTR